MNKPEAKIQHDCLMYLRRKGIFAHSVPNEAGGRSKIEQMQLISTGLVSGVADLVVWWPNQDWLASLPIIPPQFPKSYPASIGYVEFKSPTGKQSDRQVAFQTLCIQHGIEYAVIRSLEDMKGLLDYHIGGEDAKETQCN